MTFSIFFMQDNYLLTIYLNCIIFNLIKLYLIQFILKGVLIMYDYIFEWLKTATKEERHCKEMESFAKKHPILFMKFHKPMRNIVNNDVNSQEYIKAKEDVTNLFSKNEDAFKEIFEAVKRMRG